MIVISTVIALLFLAPALLIPFVLLMTIIAVPIILLTMIGILL